MTRAFVFPGQGAQSVGMGRDLAQAYPAAKAVFDEVDAALGLRLSRLIWEGDEQRLTLTENAQPALLACSMAVVRALESEGLRISDGAYVAGHSLGEYSALTAAGALDLTDAARLVRLRGSAMQDAVPVGTGAMAAILGIGLDTVREVAAAAAMGEVCEAANDNDPMQVVVSGHAGAVARAVDLSRDYGAKRAVMLPVSAPFHCALMQPAAEAMRDALAGIAIARPCVPLVANVTAAPVSDPEIIRAQLVTQITGAVRWRETVLYMAGSGVGHIWELGSGKALSGMVRRIVRDVKTEVVSTPQDVASVLETA